MPIGRVSPAGECWSCFPQLLPIALDYAKMHSRSLERVLRVEGLIMSETMFWKVQIPGKAMTKQHAHWAISFIPGLLLLGVVLAAETEAPSPAARLQFSEHLISGKYTYGYGVAAARQRSVSDQFAPCLARRKLI